MPSPVIALSTLDGQLVLGVHDARAEEALKAHPAVGAVTAAAAVTCSRLPVPLRQGEARQHSVITQEGGEKVEKQGRDGGACVWVCGWCGGGGGWGWGVGVGLGGVGVGGRGGGGGCRQLPAGLGGDPAGNAHLVAKLRKLGGLRHAGWSLPRFPACKEYDRVQSLV